MPHRPVSLRVTPCFSVECKFWLDDSGWNGSAEEFSIAVQAGSFEQAKGDMELALARHIEALIGGERAAKAGRAA